MADISNATREIMWNVSSFFIFYLLFFISLIVFVFGAYRRISNWRRAKPDKERFLNLPKRICIMVKTVFFQNKVIRSVYPGIYHSFFFYSFAVLAITTFIIFLDYDIGVSLFRGNIYAVLSFLSEIAGILVLIGVVMALWRRIVIKPETLETKCSDIWWLAFLSSFNNNRFFG